MGLHQIDDGLRRRLSLALEPITGQPIEPTDSQKRLIAILLNPVNSPVAVQCSEKVDPRAVLLGAWGGLTGADADRVHEVNRVVAFLLEHYFRAEQRNGGPLRCTPFVFSWENETGAEITGFEVGIELDRATNCWLTVHHDISALRYPAAGLRYALHVAELIDADYQLLLAKALKNNLLPPLQSDTAVQELDLLVNPRPDPKG